MKTDPAEPITHLLLAAGRGDRAAFDRVYTMLYPELRVLAHRRLRRNDSCAALDTTSLVHESYLKLAKAGKLEVENRGHFLSLAACVMRSVVVDFIRHARSQRSGGDNFRVTLNTGLLDSLQSSEDEILRLDDLLVELKQVDARLVSVVEMRYFAALDTEQIAECLGVTSRTVSRDLEKIRLLLLDARP